MPISLRPGSIKGIRCSWSIPESLPNTTRATSLQRSVFRLQSWTSTAQSSRVTTIIRWSSTATAGPSARRATMPAARVWILCTGLGLGLLMVGLIFAAFSAQRRLVREIEQDSGVLDRFQQLAMGATRGHLTELERELLRLSKLAELQEAIVLGDRATLLEQLRPPLNRLGKGPLRVKRITFYTPTGTVYLRAHAPDAYGENVLSHRRLVAEAVTARRALKGLEAEEGVPYLWVVTPFYHEGHFIGILEMGSSFASVVEGIKTAMGGEVA